MSSLLAAASRLWNCRVWPGRGMAPMATAPEAADAAPERAARLLPAGHDVVGPALTVPVALLERRTMRGEY